MMLVIFVASLSPNGSRTSRNSLRSAKRLRSLDWQKFYALVAYHVEIYESGREEQCRDGE
jgi:hypothetical protein